MHPASLAPAETGTLRAVYHRPPSSAYVLLADLVSNLHSWPPRLRIHENADGEAAGESLGYVCGFSLKSFFFFHSRQEHAVSFPFLVIS